VELVNAVELHARVASTDNIDLHQISSGLEVDGVVIDEGDILLLKMQTENTENGLYVVDSGELIRADNFNSPLNIRNGLIISVLEGETNADTQWETSIGSRLLVIDITPISFIRKITETARIVELTFEIEGDDETVVFDITHDLDTMNVTHEVYDTEGDSVMIEFRRTSSNTVRLSPGEPLGVDNNLVLVIRAEIDPSH